MDKKMYEFEAVIEPVPDKGGAYIRVPFDIKKEFGKGRIRVDASFDGVPYTGSIVNMGVKNDDGSICYILGIRKDIREKLGKIPGDRVFVTVKPADSSGFTCPKCGRTFERKDQDHYCGEAPKTIDEYILCQPQASRAYLRQIDEVLRCALPDAVRKISWSMPTYWQHRNLIHFAAFKKHVGLYPGPDAVAYFADELAGYKSSKGAIQFPYDKPLPLELIGRIARWCFEAAKKDNA